MEKDPCLRQRRLSVGTVTTVTSSRSSSASGSNRTSRSGSDGANIVATGIQPKVVLDEGRPTVRSSLRIPYRWTWRFAMSISTRNRSSASSLMVAAQIICLSCALWILLFLLVGGTATAKDLYASLFPVHDKAGVPMVALVLPTLIAGTFASLWSIRRPEAPMTHLQPLDSSMGRRLATRGRLGHVLRRYCLPGGDPDFRQWGILAIVVPCLLFATFSVYRKALSATTTATAVAESGNAFGITALVALSILLIPVARHGNLLQLWGWNPAAAIRLHICAGRCVMAMVLLHGGCHIGHWMMLNERVLSLLLLIPRQCFTTKDFQPKCESKLTDCSCYAHARNLTGVVGALALLVIGVSTLNVVRRRLYSMFYKIHILAGPTVLLCTILHWNRSIFYLSGALLYYVACTCPTWIEHVRSSRSNAGVQVISVERIVDDDNDTDGTTARRPCVALTFAASDAAMSRYRAGQYVKLNCGGAASVSSLWHPFTVNLVPNQTRQLRLIVRCTGPFTSQLFSVATAAQLAQYVVNDDDDDANNSTNGTPHPSHGTNASDITPLPPAIRLDGFHGCPFRVEQVLRHDVVVMVAGGVGITPYLSLIHKVHALSLQQQQQPRRLFPTRRITLHWTCRDAALVAFVQREYIDAWVNAQAEVVDGDKVSANHTPTFQLQICIHETGRRSAQHRGASGRAASYTDLENPQECEVNGQVIKGSLTTTPSTVPSMHQSNCVPFTPSRFTSGSKSSVQGNAASFVSFTLTVWIGLVGVWYLYRNKATKSSIFPRIYAPIFILAWALAVSFAVHWLFAESILARYCGFHDDADDPISTSSSWEPLFTNESSSSEPDRISRSNSAELGELELSVCNPDSIAVDDAVVGERRDDTGPQVQVERSEGRPTVYQFLNSLDGSRSPGLFACGPVSLLNDIRRATDERCLLRYRQCIRGEPNIALYEEAFEM